MERMAFYEGESIESGPIVHAILHNQTLRLNHRLAISGPWGTMLLSVTSAA